MEQQLKKALLQLYNECVAAGFEHVSEYGWKNAMREAKLVLTACDKSSNLQSLDREQPTKIET